MNLLIFSANWYNRGDEAAVRAMIDEIKQVLPDCHIKIHFNQEVEKIPYDDIEIIKPFHRINGRNKIKTFLYRMAILSNGKVPYIGKGKDAFYKFIEAVKWADYAVYAPGGPCIGDLYSLRDKMLDIIEIIDRNHVPFSLFAPSVGPFTKGKARVKKLLGKAQTICFREPISQGYFQGVCPGKKTTVTLDSAFQHPVDVQDNQQKFNAYRELNEFLNQHDKVIGITVTDLKWHRNYRDGERANVIRETFKAFVSYLEEREFGVLFIPQLFGKDNDKTYMSDFAGKNSLVMSDEYDCYFQQYVISKLYAVVGMRYHSNIFSAKTGTPFLSVSYEQKMAGFMNKAGLQAYCIPVQQLSFEVLKNRFEKLLADYDDYKADLQVKRIEFQRQAFQTTEIVVESIRKCLNK